MKIQRDYNISKNNSHISELYNKPLKEWLKFSLKAMDALGTKYFSILYNLFSVSLFKKNNILAKDKSHFSNFYAKTENKFYEIQIGDETRTCNVINDEQEIIYHFDDDGDFFIFGIAPLIEINKIKKISSWSCEINILDYQSESSIKKFILKFPFNFENRNDYFIYQARDGWINIKINLKEYKDRKLKIKIIYKKDKKKNKNNFSIASPQFISSQTFKKNIILLSIESLTDFYYLTKNYNYKLPEKFNYIFEDFKYHNKIYSNVDSTLPYAASIFSGLFPSQHGIGDYSIGADKMNNSILNKKNFVIQELLKQMGFLTFFAGTASRFNSKIGFAKYFDHYFQVNNNYENEPLDINFLKKTLNNFKNFNNFFLMHLDFLHSPMISYNENFQIPLSDISLLATNQKKLKEKIYFNNLNKVFDQILDLTEFLKKNGLYDETLIILTGDHGSGMNWDKNDLNRDMALYEERIRVPLMVKYPNWSNIKINATNNLGNSITEIFKIIFGCLNIEIPRKLQLLPQFIEKKTNFALTETIMNPGKVKERHAMAFMTEKYKYVSCNNIDWDNCLLRETVSEKFFLWDENKSKFVYNENTKNSLFNRDYQNIKNQAFKILEKNLTYLKDNPVEKY